MKRICVALILLFAFLPLVPANAVLVAATSPTVDIEFTKIPQWLTASDNSLSVHLTKADKVKTVRLSVYTRVTTEQSISDWLTTSASRALIKSYKSDVAPNATNDWATSIPQGDFEDLGLDNAGAFPIVITALDSSGKTLGTKKSFLITKPTLQSDSNKLSVANIYPTFSEPLVRKDGSDASQASSVKQLIDILAILQEHPNTPVALRLYGDTANKLATSSGFADVHRFLSTVADHHEIIGGQWAPYNATSVDPTTITDQSRPTSTNIEQLIGHHPNIDAWSSDTPFTDASLKAIQGTGTQYLIASGSNILVKRSTDPELPVHDSKTNLVLLPSDQIVTNSLAENTPSGTENALAALTVRYLAHSTQDNRHIVLAAPSASLLDAPSLSRWLTALENTDFISLESVQSQVRLTPLEGTLNVKPAAKPDKKQESIRSQTATEITDFDSFVLPGNELDERFHGDFLTSDSSWLSASDKTQYWQSIRSLISKEFAKVQAPPNFQQRLTTQQVTMPITIRSRTDYPVKITVELDSSRVDFLNGSSQTLTIDRSSKTARFAFKARSSGSFPVKVVLRLPTRKTVLAQSTVTVDAFAATHVGIALTIISLAVLVIWWGHYIWKRRKILYKPSTP